MEHYLLDWANLLLRALHVVTAIAWIGSSFYFVWLDNHLEAPAHAADRARGVGGELWAVHGGGFYNPQKYPVGPAQMPQGKLHWFYWESYSTWLSGFALFVTLYLWNADTFLVDKSRFDWPGWVAGLVALAFLVVGWFVYDGICRLAGRKPDGSVGGDARVAVLVSLAIVVASWLACQLFAGRAAFLLVGAMLATWMSANVAAVIIPGQRKVVAALQAGQAPDAIHGQRGKQRSVHNTYLTLPVLAAMLSNHYPMLTQPRHNWLVLCALLLLGALMRQFFVARHRGPSPWALMAASVALLAALVLALAPAAPSTTGLSSAPVDFAQLRTVIDQRCVGCHNAQVQGKAIALHEPELIVRHASLLYLQTVVTRQMPMGNATAMTDPERELVQRWFLGGARGP